MYTKKLIAEFEGMSDKQSWQHQLKHWVRGYSLHNPIRDECCPDFSCCNDGCLMSIEVREKFAEAVASGDDSTVMSILGMALSGLAATSDVDIHIGGEDSNEQ